jgi:membrane protein required for colicin V production
MSILDIIGLISLGYHGFMGFRHGFLRQVLDLAALGFSTYLGFSYYPEIARWLSTGAPTLAKYSAFLGFVVIWIAIFIGVTLISTLLNRVLSYSFFLGPLNRFLGIGLGLVKGILILIPLVLPAAYFHLEIYERSQLVKPFTPVIKSVIHTLSLR